MQSLKTPTILITGGTGLVGKALTKLLLRQGYAVTILTRRLPRHKQIKGISYALWDV
ncbi:MAG TPA: NAD-dependent epimerase/dehydratase family protein, partial [Ferruginibacter sp.]|nr:NAD-dependent epimerase/dehydratase family protein [Ferruginibacter sp.]